MRVLELRTQGSVKANDDREFTRLVGGFGEGKPMFALWQASDLLGLRTAKVVENFERNMSNFEEDVDFVDLKSLVPQKDKTRTVEITDFFKSVGITHHKYGRAKRWLAFSFSGMMKLVKIATTKESWEVYNNFLEDYFKTKSENQIMRGTIEEQIKELKNRKALLIGLATMEDNEDKRMEHMREIEVINKDITKLRESLTRENIIKQLQPQLHIAETVGNTKSCYDMGDFAKILGVDRLGRNNMFKWLRSQEILMSDNVPYQKHLKYFKVVPVVSSNGYKSNKTLVKPNGVEYIVKRLIKDGKVVTRTVSEIVSELENCG